MTSIIKIVLDDMRQQHGGDFALKVVEKFDEGVGVTVNTTVSPFVAWREAAGIACFEATITPVAG